MSTTIINKREEWGAILGLTIPEVAKREMYRLDRFLDLYGFTSREQEQLSVNSQFQEWKAERHCKDRHLWFYLGIELRDLIEPTPAIPILDLCRLWASLPMGMTYRYVQHRILQVQQLNLHQLHCQRHEVVPVPEAILEHVGIKKV